MITNCARLGYLCLPKHEYTSGKYFPFVLFVLEQKWAMNTLKGQKIMRPSLLFSYRKNQIGLLINVKTNKIFDARLL